MQPKSAIVLLFFAAAMVFGAFSAQHPAQAGNPNEIASSTVTELEGAAWRLVEMGGRAVILPVGEKMPFIIFDPAKKQATGYAGCNSFFGGYTLDGASLTIGPVGATRRACEGTQDEIEMSFLKALGETRAWKIEDSVLLLQGRDTVLARFKAEAKK